MTPVGVEVWRGDRVESRHLVSLAIVDAEGRSLLELGQVSRQVFPRSAIKPLQALPLIETGAADAFAVSGEELALACASHGGETMHVERVAAWQRRLGLDATALACGAHPPLHKATAEQMLRDRREPCRLHNNCSGKHTGMLTTALHMGEPVQGYEQLDHPVQQRIAAVLRQMGGEAELAPPGVDGCGVPAWSLELRALALAFARLAAPERLEPGRAAAARRLIEALRAHPELVAGTGRCCTAVMEALPHVLTKTGAEGVFVAALPGRGIGLALKAEDGAGRAAEVALLAALDALGAVTDEARPRLAAFARPEIRNAAGLVVGRIAPAGNWPGALGS
ncbi:asparaginase [Geminicoccaceae bacterium 1502E]|nr:asparaginase [Geminicoccaceae bacterium 1502E]